jgi:hypothetical protein
MAAASWLLFFIALLGGTDIVVYHTIAHSLRRHAPSRAELVTHAARGPTYALLFLLLPNVELHGRLAWCLVLLLVAIAILYGALCACAAPEILAWSRLPDELVLRSAPVPGWMRWTLVAFTPLVLATGFLDARAVLRLSRQKARDPEPRPAAVLPGSETSGS